MKEELQRKMAKDTPYFGHIGIEVVEIGEGYAKLQLDFKDHLTHPFGYFHGGVIASLADSAGIHAVMSILHEGEKALTLEMKINYCAAVKDVPIYDEGRVVHRGKRFAVTDVDVKSADGKLAAKAIVTCAIS